MGKDPPSDRRANSDPSVVIWSPLGLQNSKQPHDLLLIAVLLRHVQERWGIARGLGEPRPTLVFRGAGCFLSGTNSPAGDLDVPSDPPRLRVGHDNRSHFGDKGTGNNMPPHLYVCVCVCEAPACTAGPRSWLSPVTHQLPGLAHIHVHAHAHSHSHTVGGMQI